MRSLLRFSDYLNADISMMTVHSAKGFKWDTLFIPGVTRFDWPGVIYSRCESAGMCSRSAYGCRIVDAMNMPDGLIEEMGLLYVASLAPAKRYTSPLLCSAGQIMELLGCLPFLFNVSSGH